MKRTFILSSHVCFDQTSTALKQNSQTTFSILRAPTKHRGRSDNKVEWLENSLKQAENFLFSISAQESTNYSRERWRDIEAKARDQIRVRVPRERCVFYGHIDFWMEFWSSTFLPHKEFMVGRYLTASTRASRWCKPHLHSCFRW